MLILLLVSTSKKYQIKLTTEEINLLLPNKLIWFNGY